MRLHLSLQVGLIVMALAAAGELTMRHVGAIKLRELYFQGAERPWLEGDINILCLGESSTTGLHLDFKDSYPKQLERMLQKRYGNPRIRAVVPPHVGQNTSQVLNRFEQYLQLYRPKLILMMMGVNNEWALGESNIGKFISENSLLAAKIRVLIELDRFKTFKLARYLWVRIWGGKDHPLDQNPNYIWGHPEYRRFPPEGEIYQFALDHIEAFRQLWFHDLRSVIRKSKEAGVNVGLMTYNVNPGYLRRGDFSTLAAESSVPLIENHLLFEELSKKYQFSRYVLQDGWHPNAEGYRLIAENALRKIIDRNLLGLEKEPVIISAE
jgi:hypothetical protein